MSSFPRFKELPKEIRLNIWEHAIQPRVVEVVKDKLKVTFADLERQVMAWSCDPKRVPDELVPNWRSDEEMLQVLENVRDYLDDTLSNPYEEEDLEPAELLEIRAKNLTSLRSTCPPPALLLACKESNSVASKRYKREFYNDNSPVAFPETYFDHSSDVAYLQWDTFVSVDGYHFCPKFNSYRHRVKYLALLVDEFFNRVSPVSPEKLVIAILSKFFPLQTLTLVARRIGDYPGNMHDQRSLSLSEPFDTDRLEEEFHHWLSTGKKQTEWRLHSMPMLDLGWLHVDMDKLRTQAREDCISRIPDIDYKIVMPDDYQSFIKWTQEQLRQREMCLSEGDSRLLTKGDEVTPHLQSVSKSEIPLEALSVEHETISGQTVAEVEEQTVAFRTAIMQKAKEAMTRFESKWDRKETWRSITDTINE